MHALAQYLALVASLLASFAASADSVKIAYMVPLTGAFADVGENALHQAQYFVDQINAQGGVVGGRKFELVPMDTKNNPQEALLLLKQAVDQGIRYVSHCCASHVSVALSEAIERHNERDPDHRVLLLVEMGDWDVVNGKCSFWTFAFYGSGDMLLEAMTSVAAREKSVKRVYLINQDYVWGHLNQRSAREMLAQKRPDITIVGDDLVPLGKVKDFSPYVAKIKAANAHAVFTGNWGSDLSLLIKAAAEAGLKADFYATWGFFKGTTTAIGPAGVDKVKAQLRWHPNLSIAAEQRVREEFRIRYNEEYYAFGSENELAMLVAAMAKSRTDDPLPVAYAMEGLRIEGSMGAVVMREDNHQLVEPLYVFTMTRVNGRDVTYGVEGTNIGTRTVARLDGTQLMQPTRCQMRRPPRP